MGANYDNNYPGQAPFSQEGGYQGGINQVPVKKKKKFPIVPVSIGVGVLAVIAIIAVVLLKSGLFMSDQQKVFQAINNTVKEEPLLAPFTSLTDLRDSDAATVDFTMNNQYGTSVTITSAANTSKGQFSIGGTVNTSGMNVDFKALVDDSTIRISLPDASSKVLEYDYTKENNGYLKEMAEQNMGPGALDNINKILSSYMSMIKKSKAANKNFEKKMGAALKDVKTEKTGSKDCEIGGKDQKCDEYTMTLTKDNVKTIVEAYFDAIDETYGQEMKDMQEAMEALGADSSSMDMDQMKEQILSQVTMKDTDIHFYIKDKKLAALDTEYEGSRVKMEFRGGDRRTSDILITAGVDGSEGTISKTDELSGKEDKGSISVDGEPVLDYTYNTDSGKFTVSYEETDYYGSQTKEITGTLKGGSDSLQFAIDGFNDVMDMDMTIKEGARIESITGDVLDLGSASEEDLTNVIQEISESFGQY